MRIHPSRLVVCFHGNAQRLSNPIGKDAVKRMLALCFLGGGVAATPLFAVTNDPAPAPAAAPAESTRDTAVDNATDPALERLLAGMDEGANEPLANQEESQPLFPTQTGPSDPGLDSLLSVLTDEESEPSGPLDESNPLFPTGQKETEDQDHRIQSPTDALQSREQPEQNIQELESKIGQLEETNERLREESKALAQELADAENQCAQLAGKLKAMETDRAAETAQLRERLAAFEAQKNQSTTTQTDQTAVADDFLPRLRSELAGKEERLLAVEQENQQLRKQQQESAAFLRDLRTETAEKDAKLKEAERIHAAEIGQLRERCAGLENELAQAASSRDGQETLSAEHAKLKKELAETTQRLGKQLAREQAAAEALRTAANAKDDRIRSLQTEVKNAKDRAVQAEYLQKQLEDRANKKLEAAARENAELARRLARLGDNGGGQKLAVSPAKEDSPEKKFAGGLPPAQPVLAAASPLAQVRQLLQNGDNELALVAAREAGRSYPADVNLALLENLALIRLQRYAEAAGKLADLAKNHPRNAEIHAALGAAMMGSGFYDEAREILLMAYRIDKTMPECLFNLAQLHAFIDPVDIPLARKFYVQARGLGLASNPKLEKALQ